MPEDIWAAIRADRAQGLSLRTLALKYGFSKSYIGEVLSTGQKPDTGQPHKTPITRTPPTPAAAAPATEPSTLTTAIAHTLIKKIAKQVLGDIDAKDMKLLADTLSQCNKILVGSEIEAQEAEYSPYDLRTFLSQCTLEELVVIGPVIDAVAARVRTDDKITPMRRIG